VRLWSRIAEEEQSLRDRLAKAEQLAHRDELTGLGNRRSFGAALDYALEYIGRYGGAISIVLVDLDGMKRINDQHGHPAGDAALRTVADVLRTSTRTTDHAARLGGDEFGIVMPQTRGGEAALVSERIRERIASLVLPGGARLSASFGVASVEGPGPSPVTRGGFAGDELFSRADKALYEAKRHGKNRVKLALRAA
jgi:diguanylate cyclase (GGDEF)-like protein